MNSAHPEQATLRKPVLFRCEKELLPANTARAKGNFKYFSPDFLFWTSHTQRVPTASRDLRMKTVIAVLSHNKPQHKLKIICAINQNTKHVQPDFIYILKLLCFFYMLSLRDMFHKNSWARSLDSVTEICLYYTGPAKQLHLLKILRRLKSFKDNQNLHCKIISFACF